MGAWGTGVYENDESLDLLNHLEDNETARMEIRRLLRKSIARAIWLNAWTGERLLALAAVSIGYVPEDADGHTNYQQAVRNVGSQLTSHQYARLERLVYRVINGPRSELIQSGVWLEPGELEKWQSAANKVHSQLSQKRENHSP